MPLTVAEFVDRLKQQGVLWSLKDDDDGWAMHEDPEEDADAMPVWLDEASARACAVGDWAGFAPVSVTLASFREDFLPALDEECAWVGINFGPDEQGVTVDPVELAEWLAAPG